MAVIVATQRGKIEGIENEGVAIFRSIPYARPPLGELRWRAPRPVEPWTGVRDVAEVPPAPPQPRSPMEAVTAERELTVSEDCLYLSLWTPACDAGRRPVLVWLHGGGLLFGQAADPAYDGASLVRRGDVIVVSVGYRLGALGILAHPGLVHDGGGIGNFALLDQIAALAWVRDEIGAFGGDAENVTVFGESAGAMSVGALMATPRARGLFHGAISQSGGACASPPERAAEFAEKLARELGTEPRDIHRLRQVPTDRLVKAQHRAGIFGLTIRGGGFTIDGHVLPAAPLEMIRKGSSRGVSLLAGTNRDEAWLGLGLRRGRIPELSEADVAARVAEWLANAGASGSESAARAVEIVRAARAARGEGTRPIDLLFAIETEFRYRRLCLEQLEAHLAHTPDAYAYRFDWESKALGGLMGAAHGLDIPFVFGNFGRERFTGPIGAPDRALSARMQDAWIAFARTGDPSTPALGEWPRYDTARRATQILGLDCRLADAPQERERLLWAHREASS